MSTAPTGRRRHAAPPQVPASEPIPTSPPIGLGPLPIRVAGQFDGRAENQIENQAENQIENQADSVALPGAWAAADAWVLAAVRVCGTVETPGSLFDFVAACDALHHLIVSRHELGHAVQMLLGAGLVVADPRGLGITPSGRTLVTEAARTLVGSRPSRSLAAQARNEAVFAALNQLPVTPQPWGVPERAYEAACLEYRHMMWTEHRRPERRF